MDSIKESNGGTVELAGAEADTLLLPVDDESSAVRAVSTWCSAADGVICVTDGVEQSIAALNSQPGAKPMDYSELQKTTKIMMDAIKVAAKEASGSSSGVKVAVLPADMEAGGEEKSGPGLLQGLLGGNKVEIPASLNAAMGGNNLAVLRYGELFGLPESSVRMNHALLCLRLIFLVMVCSFMVCGTYAYSFNTKRDLS